MSLAPPPARAGSKEGPPIRRLPVAAVLLLAACGPHPPAPPAATGLTPKAAAAARASCTFGPGAMAKDTLAASWPVGAAIPIDHVILVMQENESFDHYYSHLPGVDGAPGDATNPDPGGAPVARYHETRYCVRDLPHSWDASHAQYDHGKNDGFVAAANPGGRRSLGWYDATDLPFYYALSEAFAVSDRSFASLLGPTWPNRIFFMAATSYGLVSNTVPPIDDPAGDPYPNLWNELDHAKIPWKDYSVAAHSAIMFPQIYVDDPGKLVPIDQFFKDASAGHLPPVTLVEADINGNGARTDEHPPGDMQLGQAFVARVVRAVMASPEWAHAAIFITYDENGGYYDHVPPPKACAPDDLAPKLKKTDATGGFDRYGFRVPLIVVSPYAKRHYVSHVVVGHTAILRFVEARFGLPAMTRRDANADPLYDLFDFAHPDPSVPSLPKAVVDPGEQARCAKAFPP